MRISDWSSDVCSSDLFPAQKGRVEQLGLVARAGIGEHGDDGVAWAEFASEADRAGQVDAAGAAGAPAFLGQQAMQPRHRQIGREECRERTVPLVLISVVALS